MSRIDLKSLLFIGSVSLLLSLVLTPLIRNLFRMMGVVDQPDTHRKLHAGPIPRVGGISIVLAYVLSFCCLLFSHSGGSALIRDGLPLMYKLMPGAGLIFLTGIVDDIVGLRPYQKLIGQISASLLAYSAGIRIESIGGIATNLAHFSSWWSCPLTVLWLVACMNAFNLIDGLDGLASGLSLVSTTTILMVALGQGNIGLALATVPLVGALLGFLRYNISPATIFLGDCGSLFVGFLLACFAVVWSEKSATVLGMTAPLIALCIPLVDTALAIGRRFLKREPIFEGDRGHIHHRLLDRGFSTCEVAFALSSLAALAAVVALSLTNQQHELVLIGIFLVAVWIGIQRLNYAEFDVAGRMVRESSFQNMLKARMSLNELESRLAASSTIEDCWASLSAYHREFGFLDIYARLGGKNYEATEPSDELRAWRLEIPLSPHDSVWLTRARHPKTPYDVCLPFADVVRKVLEPKFRLTRETMPPTAGAAPETPTETYAEGLNICAGLLDT